MSVRIAITLQRFGVKQKERLASFKTSVDVLTLSATPITQTLYLALTGFPDASLITPPPLEGVPIRTHLSAYTKERGLKRSWNFCSNPFQMWILQLLMDRLIDPDGHLKYKRVTTEVGEKKISNAIKKEQDDISKFNFFIMQSKKKTIRCNYFFSVEHVNCIVNTLTNLTTRASHFYCSHDCLIKIMATTYPI